MNVPSPSNNCARKEASGPYPRSVTWDEDFFVFTPEFKRNIYLCSPKYFFCPPPLPPFHSHATLAPGLFSGIYRLRRNGFKKLHLESLQAVLWFKQTRCKEIGKWFGKDKGLKLPAKWTKDECAGEDWLKGFQIGKKLPLRQPETTSYLGLVLSTSTMLKLF